VGLAPIHPIGKPLFTQDGIACQRTERTYERAHESMSVDAPAPPVSHGFTYIDLATWPRRPVFDFYKDGPDPSWGTTVRLDVSKLRQLCKACGWSYFHGCLFLFLKSVNECDPMRYRLQTDDDGYKQVICYTRVHASCPILRADETYGMVLFGADDSFTSFRQYAAAAMAHFHANIGEGLNKLARDDVLHGSVLPWNDFTSYQHAVGRASRPDIPKYVFGKLVHDTRSDTWSQAFCLHVHHGLMDGLHTGRFLETFQRNLDAAEALLNT
jgi:chloramphenicol O-acetyltransferase type A